MTTRVIYSGTFDPITNGHIDIIQRAAKLFDSIILAIAASENKHTLFSLEERKSLAHQVLDKKLRNVKICTFSGLLIDFARQQNCMLILRGLRAVGDFEHELQLAGMNKDMEPKIETIFLAPSAKHGHIAASVVREIVAMGGDVSEFVPKIVAKALCRKVSK